MKTYSVNRTLMLSLSMLLCASLALAQVPWAAYAVGENETNVELIETDVDEIFGDLDLDDLGDVDEEEETESDEIEPELVGSVIYAAADAVDPEDEEQEGFDLVAQVDGDIASGTLGECNWVIDANGMLVITPGTGNSFSIEGLAPWGTMDRHIKAVSIPEVVIASGNISRMFDGCSSLKSVDLSNLDTSAVTRMSGLFRNCSSLESVDLSSFDTSAVINMSDMFFRCSSLKSLDLSSFDTSAVTNNSQMFSGCSSLESLDLSSFDTSAMIFMGGMFDGCSSLKSLDLSSFDTSAAYNMWSMFSGCSSLESLDLSSFDTSAVYHMFNMFDGCSSLKSLDLSSFDTSAVINMSDMFSRCSSLEAVKLGDSFSFKGANGLSGAVMATLPEGNWMSTVANANQVFTPESIAEDRNDLADTYLKVNLVKDVRVSGIDTPAANAVANPVNMTLQAVDGALASNAVNSSWQGDFAKDSDGNDIFIAGNTYTIPVSVALGDRSVRDEGFALSAPEGFTVTPGAYGGVPVGPAGQTYTFALSYTVPPAGEHVVTLDPGNGDAAFNANVKDGEKLSRPADPTREGYVFDGWLLDGESYDFDAPVTSNMTLTAKWVAQESPVVASVGADSESTGLPPKTIDIIGWPMGLILLACACIATMIAVNRRKAYEAAKSQFHYERYAYLNERRKSPLHWLLR